MDKWSIDKARAVYNIGNWSDGFFDINESGQLVYCDQARKQFEQQTEKTSKLPFPELVQAIRDEGLQLPVLARFPGILRDRLGQLIAAFDQARDGLDYAGKYTAIYPIKVNQQRSVVESLLKAGGDRIGLEAGSKPELLAILSTMQPGGVIVCNGYKDREFIELAMAGIAIGHRVFVVIEKLSELDLLIEVAREVGLKPNIGLRIRLATVGSGNWQNSGGDKSKFGLAASEVLQAITKIKSARLEDCLDMIHFHMGSQIANLDDITQGLQEAAQFYVQCCALTRPVRVINVGGGLGVDYEGTQSRSYFSKNYSSEDYARTITSIIKQTCSRHGLPEPEIYSESGRSLTAHHAVLITNVLEVEQPPRFQPENLTGLKKPDLPVALGKLL
ncbi:MAG: biosynthetic arginine decarboxylase, partial [Acidiferrobacterales bacterium]